MKSSHSSQLRRDVTVIPVEEGRQSFVMIVDEVAGRFTRIPKQVWKHLQSGEGTERDRYQAGLAGLLRLRGEHRREGGSWLYYRMPLFSIDDLAGRLARYARVVFSPVSWLFWSATILFAFLLVAANSARLLDSLWSLNHSVIDPFLLSGMFVITKLIHELSHGVACRYVGSRCGSAGVIFIFGFPCPYCDVTDIWRQSSKINRIAVMLAGVYVELIVASIAAFVWFFAHEPATQSIALHLMIVCSISTLLFNLNPLLRYDGYYVLSDIIGSVNLRREAADSFRGTLVRRIAGHGYGVAFRRDRRSRWLACYHVLSRMYQIVMLALIAGALMAMARQWNLQTLGVLAIVALFVRVLFGYAKRVRRVWNAEGAWSNVTPYRRRMIVFGGIGFLLLMLFTPFPRYREIGGWVDASNVSTVFAGNDGVVQSVEAEFGQHIEQGMVLAKIDDEQTEQQLQKLRGQLTLATMRSNTARRQTLDYHDALDRQHTYDSLRDAVSMQLAVVTKKSESLLLRAPISGTVIPVIKKDRLQAGELYRLKDRVGATCDTHQEWCRVSADGRIRAVLNVSASDRMNLDVGSKVSIALPGHSGRVLDAVVDAVSPICPSDSKSNRLASEFQVSCEIGEVDSRDLIAWIGRDCRAVIRLPSKCAAQDLWRWTGEFFDG